MRVDLGDLLARVGPLIAGLTLVAAAACSSPERQALSPGPAEIAAALDDSIFVVEEAGLTMLQRTSSCRRIEYRRGAFASRSAETCSFGMDPFAPLDDNASADLDSIVAALDVGRTDFAGVDGVVYDPDGRLLRAAFEYHYFFGSEVFVYHPGYVLPGDEAGERTHVAINQDWYLTSINWG